MNIITNQNIIEGLCESLEDWNSAGQDFQQNILRSLEQYNYPFFESDSVVIFVYKGDARNAAFIGDINGWTDPIYFKHVHGTDIFYLKLELEPDARIQYNLIVDGNVICDPANQFKALHGLGAMSEIAMPYYERHPYFEDFLSGKEGSSDSLIRHFLPPGALPYMHEVNVYLPPNYNKNQKYPVIYFQDGPDYIRFGLAPFIINRLITEKKIKACIAVFVTPPNLHQPAVPNRSTEYGMNDDYVKFFCDELIPFIDKKYATAGTTEDRLVIGDSYAGLISLYIALLRPDLFRNVYSQSGYFSFNNDKIIKLLNEQPDIPIRLYFDIGTYEEKVGADFLPPSELDFTGANRRMRDVLELKGQNFIYREYHEGHTWGNWRRHLIDALIYFFGIQGEPQ